MPLDHVSYPVHFSKFDDEINFLVAAFGHLGLKEYARPVPGVVGLGQGQNLWLWISGLEDRKPIGDEVTVLTTHLAVTANKRSDVDTFHAAALKAGAKDNGAPGLRTDYHPNYYGAFVISPAGHNIECVMQAAEK